MLPVTSAVPNRTLRHLLLAAALVFAVASVLDTRTSDGYLFPGERP